MELSFEETERSGRMLVISELHYWHIKPTGTESASVRLNEREAAQLINFGKQSLEVGKNTCCIRQTEPPKAPWWKIAWEWVLTRGH